MADLDPQKSTNVRLIQIGVRLAERVAPEWLEAKAFWAWGRPSRWVGRWPEPGRRFTLDVAGEALAAWEWNVGGPAGTALLVHGWSGTAAQMKAFVAPLVERGFHVLAYDQPAHGESSGSFCTLPLMTDVVAALARRFAVEVVVAHSLGATATVRALQAGVVVRQVALLAPPVEMRPYLAHFARLVGLSAEMEARLVKRVEAYVGHSIDAFDLRVGAEALGRTQALVVHDRGDAISAFKGSRELVARWPGATLHETFGYGHDGVRRMPQVVDAVLAALASPAPALPARASA